jgi:hypothetical protein
MLTPAYQPRQPRQTALWQTIQREWNGFRHSSGEDGRHIPAFVDSGVRRFLSCGSLASAFARLRCTSCRAELLVAFSCKVRGLCPSCDGRQMASPPAHLVDDVIPAVPVRQWVLALPFWLRYRVRRPRPHRISRCGPAPSPSTATCPPPARHRRWSLRGD